MSATSNDPLGAAFLNWLRESGATLSPKLLLSFDPETSQRRVIAGGDLEANDELFSLPRKVLLTPEQSAIADLLTKSKKVLKGWLPVIAALMHELRNPASFWKPYLDLLPETLDTPMFWSNEDLDYLKGTRTLALLGKQSAEELYHNVLMPFVQANSATLDVANFTLDLFHRSASIVMAYSFHEDEDDDDDDDDDDENADEDDDWEDEDDDREESAKPAHDSSEHGAAVENAAGDEKQSGSAEQGSESAAPKSVFEKIAMVPLADMLNHKTGYNNARLFYGKQSLSMSCIKVCARGEELFNTYGDLPNSQLLRKYGFVDAVNEFNSVDIPEEYLQERFGKQCPHLDDVVEFLEFAGIWQPEFLIPASGTVPRELEICIAVLLQTKAQFKALCKETDEDKLSALFQTLVTKTRRTVVTTLLVFVEKRLSQYPTTLDDDQQLLSSEGPLTQRQKMALQVRMEEKAALKRCLEQLREQSVDDLGAAEPLSSSSSRKKQRK